MAIKRIEVEFSVLGFCGDKQRMCRNLIRTEEQARELIEEHKANVKRNPKVYDYCERYVIRKRENIHIYGDWEEL